MSEDLSRLLLELYRGSRRIEPELFQEWMFETVNKVLPIDGGSWIAGVQMGEFPPLHSYYLYRLPEQMIRDYVEIWYQDPLRAAIEENLGETISFTERNYRDCRDVVEFMEHFAIGPVMATLIVDPISRLRTVICLNRKPGSAPFSKEERLFKQCLTPHLIEVWTANCLSFALKRNESSRHPAAATATAVVDERAILHVAEDYFSELLRDEWPEWQGPRLPDVLRGQLIQGESTSYVGQKVVLARVGTIRGQTLLRVRRRSAYDRLGDREQEIARLVSEGMSQKEIARQCGISPATVNNHIANIYLKLGISDKAQLAKVLATIS